MWEDAAVELRGSKTEANLITAFSGESQATNKYTYYASKAKSEGYGQIGAIFEETAGNEREHAKLWFKALNGGIADTLENLRDAATGEHYEWSDMYAEFAKTTREEELLMNLHSCLVWQTSKRRTKNDICALCRRLRKALCSNEEGK